MKLEAVKTISVLGAGQMGAGIAQVCAAAGYEVCLSDQSLAFAEQAKARLAKDLERLVVKGKLSSADKEAQLSRVVAVAPEKDEHADLLIEAAPENAELKRSLFRRAGERLKPQALLASNTSSISITELSAQTQRPAQVIGMHFMNPVPVMKLVEVVLGLETSPETQATITGLAERLNKKVIVSQDRPGFIVNRILIPLLNEACFALEEGLGTAKDIDLGAKLGLNHPLGPLELADLIGLDTVLSIAEVLHRGLGEDKYRPAPLLRQRVQAGWLGKKAGKGFYEYAAGKKVTDDLAR